MELLQRATRGDLNGVETLIQQGACVNTKNGCHQTALFLACERGHTDVVRYLLENGASVSLGAKPLTAAVRNGHYECCKLLLEHHATVHCTNGKGESPMSIAVQNCDYSIIFLLLEYGAIPSASLGDLACQLLNHAEVKHTKAVQKLIDQNLINMTSENIFLAAFGFAFKRGSIELAERMLSNECYSKIDQLYPDAMYYSAGNNWPTILSKLFEKTVKINALTDGQTPLYAACKEGHETVVTLLLNNGADPNVKNERRVTASKDFSFPLQIAVQRRNAVLCNMLLQKGAKLDQHGEPLLHIACSCSTTTNEWNTDEAAEHTLSTIRLLLQQGVDVNAVSDKGDTALYRACRSHQLEMVRILLEVGADVNHTSTRRYPLIAACNAGNVELIYLLIRTGADVKCSNSSNETCLHVLINAYSPDSQKLPLGVSKVDIVSGIKSLLEVGVDVNARSSQQETALYRASKAGHEDIVRLLLDADAETNGLSDRRPLYAACERGYTEIVDLLLQHGADSNALSTPSCSPTVQKSSLPGSGMTSYVRPTSSSSLPICCAVKKGCEDIVKLLLKHGADVNKKDQSGKSAMMYVVELLISRRCKPLQVLSPLSEEKHFNILKLLAGEDLTMSLGRDDLSPLHIASSFGMCDLMMELIQHGANCNQLTSNGTSSLDLAYKNGHEAAFELLLRNGAKPDGIPIRPRPTRNYLRCGHSNDKSRSLPLLCMAAKNGSETMVKMLLKHGANVNASSEKGDTALHLATSYAVIESLLNAKAYVNAKNEKGETALSVVCQKRPADMNVVELLLKFGADPNIRFLLHTACKKNDTGIVKLLMTYGADANISLVMKDIELSPLCIACRKGNAAIVDSLLKNGADAAFVDNDGNTALHIAVERIRLQASAEEYDTVVKLLLQSDAPVNAVSNKGETPLYVCIKGLVGVTKQLLDCRADVVLTTTNSNKYPLLIARERKFRDVAVMLLASGADANVSKDDDTPLKVATANGDAELVKQLIYYGADVNQLQDISDTALHVSMFRCTASDVCKPNDDHINLDIVQALLEHGADPNVCPPYGRSLSWSTYFGVYRTLPPLSAASRCGNTALVSLLIKYGAAVDQRTKLGRTALHYAIGIDNKSSTQSIQSSESNNLIVEMLLSAGANANAIDETGSCPLYLACERGRTEIVKLLLSHGANPNMKLNAGDLHPVSEACEDHYGKTVLHCLLESQFHDIANSTVLMQLLLDGGADVNVASRDGKTPFYVACSKGLTSAVAKMLEFGAKVGGHSGMKPPLNAACRNKHLPIVQLLLSNGANPDILEVEEYRCRRTLPLHIAATDGSSELVELLLKHGANIDVTDASGNTALHRGIKNYHPRATASSTSEEIKASSNAKSVVDILLENRAGVNILNDFGQTPLYTAVSRGLLDVVNEMLQTYGGNPNIASPDKNPLVAACERRNVELVDMLLKNGSDPNLASVSCHPYSKCRLPLCTAVTKGKPNSDEIIMLLIKAGANVNAMNSEGKSALCVATENMTNRYLYQSRKMKKKLLLTTRLLLEHGADSNVLMPDGRSLLCIVVYAIVGTQRRNCQTHFIELLQLMAKHGAILSDSFSLLGQNTSCQSHGVLEDLATFDGKHEFIVDLFRAGAGFQLIAVCCNAVAARRGEVMSIRLCQAAVIAGYSPSAVEMQQLQLAAASEDANGGVLDQLVNWVNEDKQRVPSLLRQCRVVIRQQLSLAVSHRSILTAIDNLPLPSSMKMYLQFQGTLAEVDLSVNEDLCAEETYDSSEDDDDDDELCSEETSTDDIHQLISTDNSEYGGYSSDYDDFYYDGYDSSDNDYWNYDSDDDCKYWIRIVLYS